MDAVKKEAGAGDVEAVRALLNRGVSAGNYTAAARNGNEAIVSERGRSRDGDGDRLVRSRSRDRGTMGSAHKEERERSRDRGGDRHISSSDGKELDPVAEAQEYSRRAAAMGLRRYICHVCEKEFASGSMLNPHLETAMDVKHVEHRERMSANKNISKEASIEHRAAMKKKSGVARKTGIGARIVFSITGDVVRCVGKRGAPDNAWELEGGRICKFKTEGQRWRWECDT